MWRALLFPFVAAFGGRGVGEMRDGGAEPWKCGQEERDRQRQKGAIPETPNQLSEVHLL